MDPIGLLVISVCLVPRELSPDLLECTDRGLISIGSNLLHCQMLILLLTLFLPTPPNWVFQRLTNFTFLTGPRKWVEGLAQKEYGMGQCWTLLIVITFMVMMTLREMNLPCLTWICTIWFSNTLRKCKRNTDNICVLFILSTGPWKERKFPASLSVLLAIVDNQFGLMAIFRDFTLFLFSSLLCWCLLKIFFLNFTCVGSLWWVSEILSLIPLVLLPQYL